MVFRKVTLNERSLKFTGQKTSPDIAGMLTLFFPSSVRRRREADAKAAKQEARGDELAQQLVAAEATRALLVAKVREAERLAEENAHAVSSADSVNLDTNCAHFF